MTYPGFPSGQSSSDAARRAAAEGMRSASSFQRSQTGNAPTSAAGKVVGVVLILIVLAVAGAIFAMAFSSASAQFR
ncbi:MAG TPA: hypothetical protein VJT31_14745 [Rugosimonospora sp.]|nr:hypothetical protein [Rugosimonospora sp.]